MKNKVLIMSYIYDSVTVLKLTNKQNKLVMIVH